MKEWPRSLLFAGAYFALVFSQLAQNSEAEDGKMSRTDTATKLDAALRTADSLRDDVPEFCPC